MLSHFCLFLQLCASDMVYCATALIESPVSDSTCTVLYKEVHCSWYPVLRLFLRHCHMYCTIRHIHYCSDKYFQLDCCLSLCAVYRKDHFQKHFWMLLMRCQGENCCVMHGCLLSDLRQNSGKAIQRDNRFAKAVCIQSFEFWCISNRK